ncbi:hypothetical protein FHS10_000054 [Mucilaginibacter dorajii]|uniref:Uncharacterized protein n=1 Tax=Mucilaginibacter dorajii TaxID=692994 RepID=A0ABP7R193_9SPHI|nr:hypothetical protein [Mucilaginibacter dorajii]MCS3732132.1 hypothetical protein [Mucilaginibacter dorajii]
MLKKSLGILFHRKPKNYTDGLLPIYLRITIEAAAELNERYPGIFRRQATLLLVCKTQLFLNLRIAI